MKCVAEIIDESGENAAIVMRRFIGHVIQTTHGNGIREYGVIGVTQMPLKYLRVYREFMTQYFRRKYGKELERLDFPCFLTESTNIIPVELAYVEEAKESRKQFIKMTEGKNEKPIVNKMEKSGCSVEKMVDEKQIVIDIDDEDFWETDDEEVDCLFNLIDSE
jgi:hypothetical protein